MALLQPLLQAARAQAVRRLAAAASSSAGQLHPRRSSHRLPTFKQAPLKQLARHRDPLSGPLSVFLSPTSEWRDVLRARVRERRARETRSPFVQRKYDRFVRARPDLQHCGLADAVPLPTSPWLGRPQRRRLPTLSYLKARLLKKHRPLASARASSLLRLRHYREPLRVLLRTRARRWRYRPTLSRAAARRRDVARHEALEALAAAWRVRRARPGPKMPHAQRISRAATHKHIEAQ